MGSPQKNWLWFWNQGFILVAESFEIERSHRPYKRLSATIMLGLRGDIKLSIADNKTIQCRAMLIGPGLARRALSAENADIVIVDIPVSSPAFLKLRPFIDYNTYTLLALEQFDFIRDKLLTLQQGRQTPIQVRDICDGVVDAIVGNGCQEVVNHSSVIGCILKTMNELPLDQLSVGLLAKQVNLSESRLRAVFKAAIGCSISQYMRCSAVWQAVSVWTNNRRLIDIAADAGFYDLAHLNKAFNEVFGVNPKDAFQSSNFEARRLTLPP